MIAGLLAALGAAALLRGGEPPSQAAASPAHDGAEGDAMQSMSMHRMHDNPHMKMTALRPASLEDRARAEEIAGQLRAALKKYKDVRAAERDGYQIFLPDADLPEYHFTNYKYGFIGSLWFRPNKPTSLLYKKTSRGYELLGAMYTASRFATEAELNRRVPLSVARWHAHVNICLPPKSQYPAADWTRFGFDGAIATEQACAEAGGVFYPQMFGWMVHVYPFEKSSDKVWGH